MDLGTEHAYRLYFSTLSTCEEKTEYAHPAPTDKNGEAADIVANLSGAFVFANSHAILRGSRAKVTDRHGDWHHPEVCVINRVEC